jgi:hypothetical protein
LDNTYSVGTACAMTVQEHQRRIYLRYSHVNTYKLNTERTTTLRGGHLLAVGFVTTNTICNNASIILLFKKQANKTKNVLPEQKNLGTSIAV